MQVMSTRISLTWAAKNSKACVLSRNVTQNTKDIGLEGKTEATKNEVSNKQHSFKQHTANTQEKKCSISTFPSTRKLTTLILGTDPLSGYLKGTPPVRDPQHHEEGQCCVTVTYVTLKQVVASRRARLPQTERPTESVF